MAYMSQENKVSIAAELTSVLRGTGVKYSLSVRHHSTLVMKIQRGSIDWLENYNTCGRTRHHGPFEFQSAVGYLSINPYWYHEHFTGEALAMLQRIMPVLNQGNHDRSDMQSDYFDVGWYVEIKVGDYARPYEHIAA